MRYEEIFCSICDKPMIDHSYEAACKCSKKIEGSK